MRAVLATDLSDAIESAISSRICLKCLERYGITDIDLITVTSPNVTTGLVGSDIQSQSERALDRERAELEAKGFTVQTHTVRGEPHRRINGLAERVDADLVIVGSRGESPLKQRLIGSTARNMARTTVRPLFVERIARADEDDHELVNEHLFQRVLYATDFSANAERAFEQFQFLRTPTHEATLVHVQPPDRRPNADGVEDPQTRLDDLVTELESMDIDVETMVREGETTEEILAAEDEVDPTTLLIGSRGQSRLRRLLLGSTSETLIAQSNSNVLLVPPSSVR
jgi:nucleotide-binding universal stress UspA family protein